MEASEGINDAIRLTEEALGVLRTVQHVENWASAAKVQTFGLPGQVSSGMISYFSLNVAAPGSSRMGVLDGWSFSDRDHEVWSKEPGYRFLDLALRVADAERTPLQRRALVAVGLPSQAWLSWQPDNAFINAVIALEALLGEPDDSAKKFRIARRVASVLLHLWLA